MVKWKLLSGTAIMVLSFNTLAFSVEENTPFAALQWTFGAESIKPDVVIGYRSVEVDTSGDVSGWQGSLSYRPDRGVDKLKLEGVTGSNDIQYTYGGGYSLQHGKPLVSGGVNAHYLTAGADYIIGHHKIEPYVGLTTLSEYDVPAEPSTASSGEYSDAAANTSNAQAEVDDSRQIEHFPEYTECDC